MKEILSEISTTIKKRSTAIFCGAGLSYHSGMPLVSDLIKKILAVLEIGEEDASIILNSNIPFEFFIETIRNEVNVDEILNIFSSGEPNTNHELIAELAKSGLIKNIVTTNFDLLIETALVNKGLQRGTHFEVFATEEEFGKVDWSDNCIKIIKIHGCVSNKSEMAITLKAVASRAICVNKNDIIRNFFSKHVNPNVIVIGYSCSDLFDISPEIELIEQNSSEIFFVEHLSNANGVEAEDIALKQIKNPFKSFNGKRISIDTDQFVKTIWNNLISEYYQFKSCKTSWIINVSEWMLQSIKSDTEGVKHHISARLYYNIGEFEYAVKYFERGIFFASKIGNQITFYSELGNLGMAFNAVGRYQEAKKCLEESVTACHDFGNMQGEISQLQSLGNVYRNLGEFDSALRVYKTAVLLAEKEELFGLSTSLGNMASIYTQLEQPDEALECLEKGLKIALRIGNKQSEGSMLCSIGIAHFQKGDYEKAILFIQDSINTTRLIGDRQGECMALLNLSNVNLQIEEFDKCIENAMASLQIAESIVSRQGAGGATYNIGSSYYFKGESKTAIPYLRKAIEIFYEIYGNDHRHTQMATKALIRAERFPEYNQMTKMNLI